MLDKTLQERVQQRNERPTHHKQQKGTVSNTQKKTERENCDPMKLKLSYIQKYNSGRFGHREGEREFTYWYPYLPPPPYSSWTRSD